MYAGMCQHLPQTAMNTAKKTVAPLSKRWVTYNTHTHTYTSQQHPQSIEELYMSTYLYLLAAYIFCVHFFKVKACKVGQTDLGIYAAVGESHVWAVVVTEGTHDDVSGLADLFTERSRDPLSNSSTQAIAVLAHRLRSQAHVASLCGGLTVSTRYWYCFQDSGGVSIKSHQETYIVDTNS